MSLRICSDFRRHECIAMIIAFYGFVAFAIIFGGGMLGLLLGKVMPEEYRGEATRSIVQTATAMVSLSAALVLGLLVATSKNKFDTNNKQTEEFAANLMSLDRELVSYGPESSDIRSLLQDYTVAKISTIWPRDAGPKPGLDGPPAWQLLESVQQRLRDLSPQSTSERLAATNALQIAAALTKTTWLQTAQESDHLPQPFILLLILWLFVLFISFGLFAPRNALVVVALVVCALSIASAVALIVDMDSPFKGIIFISSQPMQKALAEMSAR
jgi:hypothetical protein